VPRGAGSGIVSRIHVEDLAAIVEAGVFSDVQGAWPVADDAPCSSAEIARWCAQHLQLEPVGEYEGAGSPGSGRKVDGSKIREMLGVELKYASWHIGVPASIAEEDRKVPSTRPEARRTTER
jgi:nucleoside-diphosphate-sugar epimerase